MSAKMIITRRQLFLNGVRVSAALPVLSPLHWMGSLARQTDSAERVLVVVQLSGGNDGLNMLIPHRQDAYYRSRPTLALPQAELHALDDDHGLHPQMAGLAGLYREGRLACVHAAGYPDPNRSHFRSMEIWHTADPSNPPGDHGWLGAMADQIARRSSGSMPSMQIGAGGLPLALRGTQYFAPTVRAGGMRLEGGGSGFGVARERLLEPSEGADSKAGDLTFLRGAARMTYLAAERMTALSDRPPAVQYPGSALAGNLKLVAQLIHGDFGTRIFHVELAGFDTHARQAASHGDLLGQLSGALTAFQRDLEAGGDAERVLTLVFSEFGRRVQENASRGTDHGAGAPLMLLGRPVRGGMFGESPDLERLADGDVPYTTDFRSVYTTLEGRWMGLVPSTELTGLDLLA